MLLGATLVHGDMSAEIVEVEAYGGADDPGSHAFARQTPRNATMFREPGLAYVYISYGMHLMLNVVAKPEGEGSAILVRAARPLTGLDQMWPRRVKAQSDRDLLSGPGKLCQAMDIDKRLDGVDLLNPRSPLHLTLGHQVVNPRISRRIGIAIGKGHELPWRYVHPNQEVYASRR
jgi:DNA-3-methyladenine glycosylase